VIGRVLPQRDFPEKFFQKHFAFFREAGKKAGVSIFGPSQSVVL